MKLFRFFIYLIARIVLVFGAIGVIGFLLWGMLYLLLT
jgi:hypothetical protein